MSMFKPDIIRWLKTLPRNAHVGINDDGMCLVCDEDPEPYLEIGVTIRHRPDCNLDDCECPIA